MTQILYRPLHFYLAYCFAVLTLYLIGPVEYERQFQLELATLLLIYHFAFSAGFILAISSRSRRDLHEALEKYPESDELFRLNVYAIIAMAAYALLGLHTYTNFSISDYSAFIDAWRVSIISPLEVYSESLHNTKSSPAILILVLFSPFYYLGLLRGLISYKSLSLTLRVLFSLVLIFEASKWGFQGKNKGIFDLLVMISVAFLVVSARNRLLRWRLASPHIANNNIKRKLFLFLFAIIALVYFDNAITGRTLSYQDFKQFQDNVLVRLFPSLLTPLLVYLTSYLTQGYHSLSHIFLLDWNPTYGIGFSHVSLSNFSSAFGEDFFEKTYQYRLSEHGIDPLTAWHSGYMWFANDIHWIGVVPLMFLWGYLFARSWVDLIQTASSVSLVLFYMLFLSIVYLPGNTQVFMQTSSFFTFVVVLSLFLFRRMFRGLT